MKQLFVAIDVPDGIDDVDAATDLCGQHPYLRDCTVYTFENLIDDIKDGYIGPTWRERLNPEYQSGTVFQSDKERT